MRALNTYLLVLTLLSLIGFFGTAWVAWSVEIADAPEKKEYYLKWLGELQQRIQESDDIDQLKDVATQLVKLAESTNSGYMEIKARYQESITMLPEILAVFTFMLGGAWWKSRRELAGE